MNDNNKTALATIILG